MFNLFSRFISRPHSLEAFNFRTAPSERIALENGRTLAVYRFHEDRLLFDAHYQWRFIASLPLHTPAATVVAVAQAYFRGFDQGQGELRELGLGDAFMAMAHDYADTMPHRSEP